MKLTVYILNSETLAREIGGAKTYEVREGDRTYRVEGVATSHDPDRYIAKDGEVVAAGDEARFISSVQKRLEEDPVSYADDTQPGMSLEF